MSLAGIDDAFELGVRQHAVGDEVRRQMRPIGRLRRRNRGHRRRLHEPGRMRLRAGNTDRLQSVFFIKRIREARALRRRPVDSLIGELHRLRFGERRTGAMDASRRRGPFGEWPDVRYRKRRRARRAASAAGHARSPRRAASPRPELFLARAERRFGSAAGCLSMTVSRVSIVVPCFA